MLLLLLISLLASAHGEGYLKGGSRPSAFQQATVQDTLRGALSGSDIQEPYSFSFESGGSSGKTYRQETGDASGLVQGLYTVSDPRGHSRIVQYTADEHGFHADIQTDEPYQQSHNPANVRFVSTGRKGSTGSLYGGSQVKGGGGLKSSAPLYEIGQSRIPYGASGLDFYSYPDQRYTQSRKGTGISKTSGPFGQQKVAPGDISQGKLHFNIDDSQQISPAFISGTKGSYRTGQSQIPYGLSGFDYYSYPSQRQRRTKTPSLSTKASGFGAKGVAGRGVSPAFLGSTGISSNKGAGSGSGPFAQKQAQFKLGESDISYKIGQSQIPYGASGFDYYSYPAQRYRGPQARSPTASKTSRLGAKGGIGGGVGPAFLGTTGVSSVKGAGSGSRPFAQVQERISPAIPSKTFRGVSPVTGGSAKGNYQFKLGESDISYKMGQSQIPYGASGFDYYSYPAQRYRGPQARSPTATKTSRLGAKGGTGGGVGPAFLGTTDVSSVKGAGSGSRPFAQVQERISPAIPSKTFRGVSPVTGGSAKGNYQFKLGESDISYKMGQSQIPYGASGFDYYSYPAQRYRGPQVRSPIATKTSRLGAKGGTGSGVGPAFLGTTDVSSVKGAGSGSRPFAQVQERISPAIPSKTYRGVSPVTGGSAKGNYQFKLGESDISYKIGQSQIPYGASGFDYHSYPAQRYRGPQVRSPTVSKTSRLGAKGGTGGGVGPAFLGSTGVPSVKGIGSGSGPFAQRQVQERISPSVPSKTFRGVSQVTDGTAQQFKLGDSQVAYKIGQSQIPYGASGLDYYSYPAFRQTPAAGKTSRSVKGGIKGASIGGLKGGIGSSIGYSSGIGKGTVSTGAIKGGSQISQTAFGIGDIQRKSPAFVSGQYSIGQSQIPYGASGLDYYSYPEYRHRQTKSPGVKGGSSGSFLGASSGGVKGASQGGFLRTAGIKGAAQGSSPFGSSSGSIKGSTKGGFPGASLRSPSGGIKTGVGSQKRPYRIGQSSIPYGASGLDFSSYPTQRLTFSHGATTFSTKTSPSLYPTAGGLSGVKSAAGSRIKGGYTSIPSRKSRDTSSLSKINRGSVTGQEKINIKLASEVAQGKIDSQVPISTKSVISSTKTPGGITRRTVVGDGSTGKTVVSQVKTYSGDIGGTKSSVSAIKTKPVGSSLDRKAGLYKVSQEKVGQEKVVQSDIGGQSGGTIGVLNALSGQRQISSVTSSSTGSHFGVSGGQSDVSFSLGGEQVGSTRGGSTGAGGVSVSSSTGQGASVGTLGRRGVSGASGSHSSEFSQGLRTGYSTYDSSENPARIEFSLGGGQGFSTYGTSSQSGRSSSGAVRGSGVSLGATRSGTSSGRSSGQVTSSQLSNIDRARSRAGISGVGTAGGRRATTSNVGLRATGFQGSSLSHGIGSGLDNPAKTELSLGDGHGFSTYGVSGLGEAVSTGGASGLGEAVSAGGGITAGTAGRRTGAALRSRGGTTSTAGGSFRSSVSEDFSLLTRTGGSRVSGISSTSGVRGAVSDLDNPAKIEFSLGSGQGFSTYGSSVGSGISSSRRTGDSGGINAVSGGAGIAGRFSGLSGIAGETGGISEQSGITGAIRGSSGLSGTAGAFGGTGLRARSGATGVSGRAGTAGLSGTVGTRGVSGTSGAHTEVGSIRGTAGAVPLIEPTGGLGAQVSSGISETAGYTSYEGPSKVEFLLGGGQGFSSYGLSGTRSGIASIGGHTRSGGAGGVGADAGIRSPGTLTSGQGVYSRRTSQRTSSSSASYGSGSGGAGGYISSEGPAQIEFFLGDGQGFSTYGASGQSGATSSRGAAGFGGAGVAGIGGAGAAGRRGAGVTGRSGAAGFGGAGVAGRSGAAGFGGAGVAGRSRAEGFGGAGAAGRSGAAGFGGAGVAGIGGAGAAGRRGAGVAGRSGAAGFGGAGVAGRSGAAGFGGAGVAGRSRAEGFGGAGVAGRSGAAGFGGAGVAGIGGAGAAGRRGAGVAGRSGAAGFGGAGVAGRSGAAGFGGAGVAGIGGAGAAGRRGAGVAGRSGAAGFGGAGVAGRSGAAGFGGAGVAGIGGAGAAGRSRAAGFGGAGVAGRSGAAGFGGAGVAGRSGAAGFGGAGVAGRSGAAGFGGAGAAGFGGAGAAGIGGEGIAGSSGGAGIGGAGVAGRSGGADFGGAGVAGRRGAGGFGGAGAAGIGGAGVAGRSRAAGFGGAGVAGRSGAAGFGGAGVADRRGAAGRRGAGVAGIGGAGAAGIGGAGVVGRSGAAGFGGAGAAGFGGAGAAGIGGAGVASRSGAASIGGTGAAGFGGAGVAGRSGAAGFGGAGVAGRSRAAGFGGAGAAGRRGAGVAGIGGAGAAGISGAGVGGRSGAAGFGGAGVAGIGGAGVAGRSGAAGFGGAGVAGRSGASGFRGTGVAGIGGAGVAGRSGAAGFGGAGVAGRSGASGFRGTGVAGIGGAGAAGIGGERATSRSQVSSALGATTGYTLNEGPSKVEFLIGSGQGSSSSRAFGQSGVTSAGRATVTGGGLGSRSAGADLRGTSVGSSRDYSGRVAQRTSTSRTTSTSSYTAGTVGSGLSSGHSAGGAGYISSDGREEIEFNLVGDEGFSTFGTSSQRGTVSSGREAGVSRTTVRSRGTIASPSRFSSGGAVATRSSGASYQAGVSGTQVATGVGGSSGYNSLDSPAKIEFQIGDDEGFSTYGTSGQIGTRSGGISGSTGVHSGAAALRSVGASRHFQGGAAGFGAAGLPTTGITAGRTSAAGYSGYSAGTAGVSSDSGASSGTSDFGEITLSGGVSEVGDDVQRRSTGAGAFQSSGVLHALPRGRTSAARSSVTGSAAGVTGATRSSGLGGAGGYTSLDGPAKIEFRLGDGQGFSTYGTSGQAGGVVSSGGITSTGATRGGSAALRSRGTASSSGAARGAAGLTSSGVISGERVSSRRVSAVGSAARVTGAGLTSSGLISGERVSSRRASVTGSAAGVTGATRSSGLGGAGGYTSLDGPAKIEFRLGDGQGFSTYGTSGQVGGVVSSGGITSAGAARRGSAGFRSRGMASSSGAAAARGTAGLTSSGIGPAGLTSSGLGTAGLTSSGFGAAGLTSSGLGTAGLTSSGFGAAGLTSSGLGTAGLTSSGLTSSGGAVRGGNALLRSQGATTGTGGITSGRISTASRTSAAGLRTGVSGTRITSSTTGTVRDYSTDDNPAKILFNLGEGQGFSTFGASGGAGSRGSAAGGSLSGGSTGGSSRISGAGGIVRTSSEDSGISLGRGGVTSSRVSSVASIAGQSRGSSRQEELRRSQAAAISGEIDGIDRLDLGGYSSGGTSGLSSGLSYTSPPKPGVGEVQQQQVVSSGGSSTVVTGEVSQQKLEQIFV